jgi:hypothetical protein
LSARSAMLRALAACVALVATTGCWEQWSVWWWPQMKWQKTVQAFEETGNLESPDRHPVEARPPEGTVPVGMPMKATDLTPQQGDALANPHPSSLVSLENGRAKFTTFCSPCHGLQGLADGPVSGPPFGKGPFVGVLPLAGPVGSLITKNFSDGHIFTAISQGIRRMPSYKRIPPDDRWDIVNYVRYLNTQSAPAAAPPQTASAAPAASVPGGTH